MRRLAALFLGLMALTGPALSAPIGVLVEERARVDYADSLPQEGAFEITVKEIRVLKTILSCLTNQTRRLK